MEYIKCYNPLIPTFDPNFLPDIERMVILLKISERLEHEASISLAPWK